MSKRFIIIGVIVIAVLAVIGFLLFNARQGEAPGAPANTNSTNSADSQPTNATNEYTFAEVSQHSSANDCWTVIDGNVYDITAYVPRHPGGSEILQACGADGSTLFNSRETSQGATVGSGAPHSASARSMLANYRIGTITE